MREQIVDAFRQQSIACTSLGSPFTGRLCQLFAENFNWNSKLGAVLENWPGNPKSSGDNVPLRLAGALNTLVLTGKSKILRAVYPPNHESQSNHTLWAAIEHALEENFDFIASRLELPPQTNELRRSAVLLPAFLKIACKFQRPLTLSEVGSSSGLNLLWDQYAYSLGPFKWGPTYAGIHLEPEWQGPLPTNADISVTEREGCDLNPLDLLDETQRIQALSYIWPDQTDRVERTISAIQLFEHYRPKIEKSDALPWLQRRLKKDTKGSVHVVFHSIVLQYFSREDRKSMTELVTNAGKAASTENPLAWLQYEADEEANGAGVTLTTWPGGICQQLARADFHGRWIHWQV